MAKKNQPISVSPPVLRDGGEDISKMEPLLISSENRHRNRLNDMVIELVKQSTDFRASLPRDLVAPIADLVRSMNCYYSNLIEGHHTHPIDIEKSLQDSPDLTPEKRELQREAHAHIAVQNWIDNDKELSAKRALSAEGICEIHRRFFAELPKSMLEMDDPISNKKITITPGEFRHADVKVGNHVAISPAKITSFMQRFEQVYSRLGITDLIVAQAAAHHRLVWIHPFMDGNGRVARLMSHAALNEALGSGGLWSISRGLARNVTDYKNHLMRCDLQRRNDLDGRGNLSLEELVAFTDFFLTTCLDQVNFMAKLMQPKLLEQRILAWITMSYGSDITARHYSRLVKLLLQRGSLNRSEVASELSLSERTASRIMKELFAHRVIRSQSPRAPITMAFPAIYAEYWLPGLFPPA